MVLIWFALIGSGDKLCDAVEYDVFPLACAPNDTVVPKVDDKFVDIFDKLIGGCDAIDELIPAPVPKADDVIMWDDGPVVRGCSNSASIRLS
jgi:hypothetical protein